MNEELKINNLNINIRKNSIKRYLKAESGKSKKIRKVFHFTNKLKKQRFKFFEKMPDMEISRKQLLFDYETQIKTESFIKEPLFNLLRKTKRLILE